MAAFRAIKLLRLARGGEFPFDMRPEERQEHICDRGSDTATENLLQRPVLHEYASYLSANFQGDITKELRTRGKEFPISKHEANPGKILPRVEGDAWRALLLGAAQEGSVEDVLDLCAAHLEELEPPGIYKASQPPQWAAASHGHADVLEVRNEP
jgi:hypothetical protein